MGRARIAASGCAGGTKCRFTTTTGKNPSMHGHGALYSRIQPAKVASRPPGEWQTMKVRLVGRDVTVTLNDHGRECRLAVADRAQHRELGAALEQSPRILARFNRRRQRGGKRESSFRDERRWRAEDGRLSGRIQIQTTRIVARALPERDERHIRHLRYLGGADPPGRHVPGPCRGPRAPATRTSRQGRGRPCPTAGRADRRAGLSVRVHGHDDERGRSDERHAHGGQLAEAALPQRLSGGQADEGLWRSSKALPVACGACEATMTRLRWMRGFCVSAHRGSCPPPKSFQGCFCQIGLCVVVLIAKRSPRGPEV